MSNVEAAASLFGSEDPTSDPFATLGVDTTPLQPTIDSLGPLDNQETTTSNFFDSFSDNAVLATSETFSVSEHNDRLRGASQFGHGRDAASHSQDFSTSDAGKGGEQGYFDERGQWPTYELPASAPSLVGHPQAASNLYDPYALTPSYDPPQHDDNHHFVYTEPVHNNYTPSAHPTNTFRPVASTNSSNDSYAPPASGLPLRAASYGSSYASSVHTPYGESSASVALNPVPSVSPQAVTRPKLSNAYDPPFPTTTKSRRSASGRSGISAPLSVGQTSYGASNPLNPSSPPADQYVSSSRSQAPPTFTRYPALSPQLSTTIPPITGSHLDGGVSHARGVHSAYVPSSAVPRPVEVLPPPSNGTSGVYAARTPPAHPLVSSPHSSHLPGNPPLPYIYPSHSSVAVDRPVQPSQSDVLPSSPSTSSYTNATADMYGRSSPSLLKHETALPKPSFLPRTSSPKIYSGVTTPPTHYGLTNLTADDKPTGSHISSFTPHLQNGLAETPPYAPPKATSSTNGREISSVPAPERSWSPSAALADSNETQDTNVYNEAVDPEGNAVVGYDPYAPKANNNIANGHEVAYGAERSTSPGLSSIHTNGIQNTGNYPQPPRGSQTQPAAFRNRSTSNGSMLSVTSTNGPEDLYAPSRQARNRPSESSDYGAYSSRYNYSSAAELSPYNSIPVQAYDIGQELLVGKSPRAPYAPSPSLLGTNDPLGRTSARIPVFSFGFGGKLVICFHGASSLDTGFDVALSSRNSTGIYIRLINDVITESALQVSSAAFPGPLFSDPGTPTVSLVRTGASQIKAKKTRVQKYLGERADEISRSIGYLNSGSAEKIQAEGKLILVRLLNVAVENDGRLSGSPQIDKAVRAALLPRLNTGDITSPDLSLLTPSQGFSNIDTHSSASDLASVTYPGLSSLSLPDSNNVPIATTVLLPSALDKIQEFLLCGDRRLAYHYALDEKLWAHAMIIASSIDKDAWKEAVNEFLRNELGIKDEAHRQPIHRGTEAAQIVNGREGLRVAYSLFSGQGSAAVQELVPQSLLSRANILQPSVLHATPMTPNFGTPSLASNIPFDTLAKWVETLLMMLSAPVTPEISAAITSLGDHLASNQWTEAAHVCYLLSPQTSPIGGLGNPAARIILLGSRNPQLSPSFHKDPDSFLMTEILEFALSLAPAVKGQDAYNGLPHLQAYRLFRAMSLAEIGQTHMANRYCEAITATLSRSSPYFTGALLEQLKGLSDRIVGAPHVDKPGSWIGGKMSKPSLDTIGGWLEGRFTKLITGDGDSLTPVDDSVIKKEENAAFGPFSHYSSISSATPSASPSPQPSLVNLNTFERPRRTGSAMASYTPPASGHIPIDRASSAMDYVRPKPSPPAYRIASAGPATTSFFQSPSFGQAFDNYSSKNIYSPNEDTLTPKANAEISHEDSTAVEEAGWWGSSSYSGESTAQTPTASTFLQVVDGPASSSSEGFISLMDDTSYSVTQTSLPPRRGPASKDIEDDEEDLGFGNSAKKNEDPTQSESASGKNDSSTSTTSEPTKAAAPERPESKTANAGSWFGRWFKRETTPGPVKANLGEEQSFYYDPELKRWVNKKAGVASAPIPPNPPPPPSRSQTASPGRARPTHPNGTNVGPPPARSASAIDLTTSPPTKTIARLRSNLVPTPESESAPNTPTGSRVGSPGPPPGRPKSQASKRNIRSRYVDVFSAEVA